MRNMQNFDGPRKLSTALDSSRWLSMFRPSLFLVLCSSFLLSSCSFSKKSQPGPSAGNEESARDAELAPLLVAADYGSFNDPVLADYVASVGRRLAPHTQRPYLPYRFLLSNAPAPSAAALPGGTVILSRGLVAQLQNEAQLAAILAHNLAHITARDPGPRFLPRASYADSSSMWDGLIAATGAPPTLPHTREQERQADAAAITTLTAAGYDPREYAAALELLAHLGENPWNTIHPHSPDSLANLQIPKSPNPQMEIGEANFRQFTLLLRSQKNALLTLAQAQAALVRDKNPRRSQTLAEQALRLLPNDYAANLIMANALNAGGQISEARHYARLAMSIHPDAPAALLTLAQSDVTDHNYSAALARLDAYAALLPRNTHIAFYQGLCHEAMNQIPPATAAFNRFLRGPSPNPAQEEYARRRLVAWARDRR